MSLITFPSINFLSTNVSVNFFITLSALNTFGIGVPGPRVIMIILFLPFVYWRKISTQVSKTACPSW